MMLTEQTLVLTTAGGRRAATRYAIGAVAVLVVFVAALVFFGRAISLPAEPSLSASLDILFGILLIAVSAAIHLLARRRRETVGEAKRASGPGVSFGPKQALGFGAFSMATNFTTLALMIPGAKLIAASDVVLPGRVALSAVLITMASIPAWLPVVLTDLAPGPAERGLTALGNLIERRGRQLVAALLAVLGVFLVIRGLVAIAGL